MTVIGALDRAGAARLRAQLAGMLRTGALKQLLDLSAVPHRDPSLLPVLSWVRARLRERGGWPAPIAYRPDTADQP